MEKFLLEDKGIKQAFLPVDLNTAAVAGERVKAEDRVSIVVAMGDSTGATVQISLKQHNAASGGDSKALSIANKYYKKAGAAKSFSKVEPEVAADAYDLSADFAAEEGVVVFEVLPEDLDVNGGFSHVSVEIADSGAAKLASGLYIVDCKFKPAHSVEL
jgi:hypothetical protein